MDNIVKIEAEAVIPTDWGKFRMIAYKSRVSEYTPDFALVHPQMDTGKVVTVRVHSECITGDLFHSQKCDCGKQLEAAMIKIQNDKGVLIYLRQEGRGIGIINKLKAYNKQEEGLDTIEANEALGLEPDYRSYRKAIGILESLGVKKIRLITNNPEKINAFDDSDIEIESRISLEIASNINNEKYLKTKKESMGHYLK